MTIYTPGQRVGLFEAAFGGARPRYGTPPFADPHDQTGGANMPTTPDTLPVKRGLAGFLDRAFNPTNALGQFGQALVAAGGGPLGQASAYMLQQREAQAHAGDKFGEWRQQYDYEVAHPKPSTAGPHYWESNDGSLHAIGEDGKPTEVYHDPTPKMNFIPDGLGGGQWLAVPTAAPGAMGIAPAPSGADTTHLGAGDKPDWSLLKGGAGSAQRPFPVTGNMLDQLTGNRESGGRDYTAGGRPVTSPKGALFGMQVMPETARDPGFGLRPANPANAADMNRLGREYRATMQGRYGNNLPKMWAAYNAGPGAVDKLIARHGENWLTHAPAETQQYVADLMNKVRGR